MGCKAEGDTPKYGALLTPVEDITEARELSQKRCVGFRVL